MPIRAKYGEGIDCSYFISGVMYEGHSHDNNDVSKAKDGRVNNSLYH